LGTLRRPSAGALRHAFERCWLGDAATETGLSLMSALMLVTPRRNGNL
jgi:hypothetical protein